MTSDTERYRFRPGSRRLGGPATFQQVWHALREELLPALALPGEADRLEVYRGEAGAGGDSASLSRAA